MNQFGFEKLRDAKKEPQARVLNWAPRIFEIEEFLSSKECDYLIRKSEPHLTRCMVGYGQGSARVVSEARTCYGTSLKSADDPIIKAIEERIALLTFFPVTHAEALHTIRYEVGQQFTDHHDFYHHPDESVTHRDLPDVSE
jgi:prolyl 4-hydroxylase